MEDVLKQLQTRLQRLEQGSTTAPSEPGVVDQSNHMIFPIKEVCGHPQGD